MFAERNIESFRRREHAVRVFHYVCRVTRLPTIKKGREFSLSSRVVFLNTLPEISTGFQTDSRPTGNIAFPFDFRIVSNEITNVLRVCIYIYTMVTFRHFPLPLLLSF